MPGTPARPRRTPQRGVPETALDKENAEPLAAAPIDSPGGLMSKRKDRVSRRYSVLKVLGRTETAISPGLGDEDAQASGPAAAAKKRRNSRVSFGHIQTAVFQKDSEHSPSPAPGGKNILQLNANNLSALPDDTVVGSPTAASDDGSEAMDITMGATGTQALPSLPPISDMGADGSFASFGDDGEDAGGQEAPPIQQQGSKPALSLADLVADDEESSRPTSGGKGVAMEFSSNCDNFRGNDRPSLGGDILSSKAADVTDHDITADIKGPGDNTRKLGDHTGAFMAGEQTLALQHTRDRDSGVMELTTAYGGIVSHAAQEPAMDEETCAMELTTAYGGIVGGRINTTSRPRMSQVGEQLTGVLSKIRGATGSASEEANAVDEREDGVAMEMRGSFGRILNSAIGTGNEQDLDVTMEEDEEGAVGKGAKTYRDDEVTMFTPLSRIKKGKNQSRRPSMAADLVMDDSTADTSQNAMQDVSPTNGPRTRSRSSTPTGRRAGASAEKAVRCSGGGSRRRSVRGAAVAMAMGEDRVDTVDKFLEEIGIRFLTNVKQQHNSRKSSVCPPPGVRSANEAASLHEKLLLVLTTGTELGQTEKNCKKLREMLDALSEAMQELEAAVNHKNPAVFDEVSDEDTERAVAVQKRMKTLKKLCRARAETRWVHWREQAQLKVEEALQKNVDALTDDTRALEASLQSVRHAAAAAQQSRRAEAVSDLAAQLQRLADSESEQALVLDGLRSQVGAVAAKKEQLRETVVGLQEAAAAARAPAANSDDSMLLAEDAVKSEDVERALHVHEALLALSPWAVARVSVDEWTVDMPRGRRLHVTISPVGSITTIGFQDLRPGARDEVEEALWKASGVEGLVKEVKSFKDLPAALQGEISFRVCRVNGLLKELDTLAKRFSIQRLVTAEGAPVVRVAALNASSNYKVSLDLGLQWHYPAGRLEYSAEWLVGAPDEEMLADVMARHSCGQQRLTRILKELSGAV